MYHLDWRFFPVIDTIDPSSNYHGVYNAGLVAASIIVAILAAFVALSISGRIVAARSARDRWAWTSAGAIVMGGGIWSMHFVAMLAFSLPCGVGYDPVGTILSMIPGVLASGVALRVISHRQPGVVRLLIGAVLMGAGIGTMHYSGMAAMQPQALLRYDPKWVAVSIFTAVVLALISLGIRSRFRWSQSSSNPATLIAAAIMGCAVAGMHYTAMRASLFFPLPDAPSLNIAVAPTTLAIIITILSVLIASITLVATFAGRQVELAFNLRAEVARRETLEQDAQSGRARLQAIFDAVADAIVTVDKRGLILQWSSGAQRIFGYRSEEIVGADLTVLMPEPHRSQHHDYVSAFLVTRQAKIIGAVREMTAIRKDGVEFPIELSVSEVRAGDEIFFTGILRDITERKRAEEELIHARQQAEAANLAKSQFLATMSHEIRTPMNGVIGMANLLASTPLSDRQAQLVDNLARSGQNLLALINDILDFSKIEAGRLELFEVAFEPREVVAEVTDLFGEQCASKGLELVYFIDEGVPSHLLGDPVRLRQILINLVGNAMKFTERGEILIEVSVDHLGNDDVALAFSVKDTGIGIAPDKHAQVFDSFHQVDDSMTRSRGGSGLGLAIAKHLVELQGGRIGVASALGRGSRFFFTARFGLPAGSGEPARTERRLDRELRTLLVDTNAVSARVMCQYFAGWKIIPSLCGNARDARTAWEAALAAGRGFDVAIIDVKGLGASGIDLARTIRSERRGRRAEVILLVGMDSLAVGDSVETLGAFAILTKPARPSALFDCLTTIASGADLGGVTPFFVKRNARIPRLCFDACVLVVEDNAVNQDVATGILENMGCRVVSAENGRRAVCLFAQQKFDLILMDCEMPEMDGFEAAARIREVEGLGERLSNDAQPWLRIPIIALTAHALAEVRERCLRAGMDDFLVKPFDELQMSEMLRRWIGSRQAARPRNETKAALAPAPAHAVIDLGAIAQIRSIKGANGQSLFHQVVSQFAATAPPLAAAIRVKSDEGDTEAVWRAAHSLKSSAAALGATLLARRCSEIEALARESRIEPVKDLLDVLDAELAAARCGLNELLGAVHELA